MTNPRLSADQLKIAHQLLDDLRDRIVDASKGDSDLVYAYKKKIRKELMYDERGTPAQRRKLKDLMWKKQRGLCAICGNDLPEKYTELDRFEAKKGYIEENVRLVHHECHINDQAAKGYK